LAAPDRQGQADAGGRRARRALHKNCAPRQGGGRRRCAQKLCSVRMIAAGVDVHRNCAEGQCTENVQEGRVALFIQGEQKEPGGKVYTHQGSVYAHQGKVYAWRRGALTWPRASGPRHGHEASPPLSGRESRLYIVYGISRLVTPDIVRYQELLTIPGSPTRPGRSASARPGPMTALPSPARGEGRRGWRS